MVLVTLKYYVNINILDSPNNAVEITEDDEGHLYNTKKNFQHSLIIEERKLAKASKNGHIIKQNLINIIWRPEN